MARTDVARGILNAAVDALMPEVVKLFDTFSAVL